MLHRSGTRPAGLRRHAIKGDTTDQLGPAEVTAIPRRSRSRLMRGFGEVRSARAASKSLREGA